MAAEDRAAAALQPRIVLQARNDAACGSRGFAYAQSFPPKLLKPEWKLLPKRRAAPTPRAARGAGAARPVDRAGRIYVAAPDRRALQERLLLLPRMAAAPAEQPGRQDAVAGAAVRLQSQLGQLERLMTEAPDPVE